MRRTIWPDYYISISLIDASVGMRPHETILLTMLIIHLKYHLGVLVQCIPTCAPYIMTTSSNVDIVCDSAQIVEIANQPCRTLSDWVRLPKTCLHAERILQTWIRSTEQLYPSHFWVHCQHIRHSADWTDSAITRWECSRWAFFTQWYCFDPHIIALLSEISCQECFRRCTVLPYKTTE